MRRLLAVVTLAGGLAIAGLQDTRLTASVSKGSTQGFRAADHNPFGVNNEYGMVDLSIEQTTTGRGSARTRTAASARLASAGSATGSVGRRCSRPTIPIPSNWNWAAADYDIDAAIDQGLNVYVTIQGAPAWPHGGVPTYHWLQCFAGNDKFDPTKPGCGPPGLGQRLRAVRSRAGRGPERELEAVRPRRGEALRRSREGLGLLERADRAALLAGVARRATARTGSPSSSPR